MRKKAYLVVLSFFLFFLGTPIYEVSAQHNSEKRKTKKRRKKKRRPWFRKKRKTLKKGENPFEFSRSNKRRNLYIESRKKRARRRRKAKVN